jgi:hypothetical protein|nr:MAG TPA: Mitochondrial association factor 1 domain, ADPribose, neofunctionalize, membrane [Caudoviricetes sp.]DAY96908.1 MAG TPA: Mitochondrial association factor 1 domain, ADPribose, neofunctionalize, membrane [Caudoviricetes sp.]
MKITIVSILYPPGFGGKIFRHPSTPEDIAKQIKT